MRIAKRLPPYTPLSIKGGGNPIATQPNLAPTFKVADIADTFRLVPVSSNLVACASSYGGFCFREIHISYFSTKNADL